MALRRSLQPWLRANMQHLEHRLPRAACLYSSKAEEQQQPAAQQQQQEQKPVEQAAEPASQAAESAGAAAPATRTRSKAEEEWTEVIDEKSGQTYYWNEKTGETTELGEPRPKTRFRDQEWEQTAQQASGPFQEGWREPPGRDHTYFYSVLGVGIGVAVGWFTQYLH